MYLYETRLFNNLCKMNSTSSNSEDFFKFIMENSAVRNASLVFCIGSMIVQPILLYTLIWYDKFSSDQKRTFINMLNSSICWLSIEYIIIVQTTEVLRLLNIIATELQ